MNDIMIGFIIGLVFGAVFWAIDARRLRNKYQKEVIETYGISDRLNINHSRHSRLILGDLEAGKYEAAKQSLCTHIALAYYGILNPHLSIPEVKTERRAIEQQAKGSPSLAAALASNKRDISIEGILEEIKNNKNPVS